MNISAVKARHSFDPAEMVSRLSGVEALTDFLETKYVYREAGVA